MAAWLICANPAKFDETAILPILFSAKQRDDIRISSECLQCVLPAMYAANIQFGQHLQCCHADLLDANRRKKSIDLQILPMLQGWMAHNKLIQGVSATDGKAMLIGQMQQTDETQVYRQILCPARSTKRRYICNQILKRYNLLTAGFLYRAHALPQGFFQSPYINLQHQIEAPC